MLVGLIFVEPVPPFPSSPTSALGKEEDETCSNSPAISTAADDIDDVDDVDQEEGGGESGLTIRVHSRADYPEGTASLQRTMAAYNTAAQQDPEVSPARSAPLRRASSGSPSERTPLLLPPQPPGHTTTSDSTTTAAVPDRNITGWALLRELDFYLIFLFNGLCAGVGLCCKSPTLASLLAPLSHQFY